MLCVDREISGMLRVDAITRDTDAVIVRDLAAARRELLLSALREGYIPGGPYYQLMASKPPKPDKVEIEEGENGRVSARHTESGVSCYGETEEEAMEQLADALSEIPGGGCAELWEYMSEFRGQ